MDENLIKGSEIVCKALIKEGVDTVFGIPGGAILPLYGTLNKFPESKEWWSAASLGCIPPSSGLNNAEVEEIVFPLL